MMIPVSPPCHSMSTTRRRLDAWCKRAHWICSDNMTTTVNDWQDEWGTGTGNDCMKLRFFFFSHIAHIFGIFSRIYLGLGVQRCVIITPYRRERVYLEALHPQDFYLVKLLLLLLYPVTMMAQDEDGTATLAGYQRNGGPSRDVTCFELLAATTHHFHLHQHQTNWGSRRDVCWASGKFFFSLFIVITLTIIIYRHYTATTTHQHQHQTDEKGLEMQHISGLR